MEKAQIRQSSPHILLCFSVHCKHLALNSPKLLLQTLLNMSELPDIFPLFKTLEERFSAAGFADDKWYIVATAALAASTDPEQTAQLYTYLINKTENGEPSARQAIVRRIREALVKSVSIVGVCKPLESILAISKLERPEDRDFSSTRLDWQCDAANSERGMGWLRKIYSQNTSDTMALFDAHKDFAWISSEITYGLYLSDRQVLDDLDTELVVLPSIMMQNLKLETRWHIRGTRRIGVSKENVQMICECVHLIAKHFGISLHKVPTVEEVESEV